jgi:hypothetical protein
MEGKNESGLFACLKILPTTDGSNFDTVDKMEEYF